MFPYLILGVALAIAAVLIAPLVTRHSAAKVASVTAIIVAAIAGAVGLFALFTGRGTMTIAALIVLSVSIIVNLAGNRAQLRGGGSGPGWGRSRGQGGRASNIETEWLSMSLNHGTGDVDGEVQQGRFAGRRLSDMTVDEVLSLLRECQSDDPQSAQLLEAYLDRVAPGWRGGEAGSDSAGAPGGQGPMTREEALDVLGLAEGASADEVRAAHRRLMREHHPDRGGSTWLAARINQAKEVLLGER